MTNISPGWSKGATVSWADGGSSTLIKFKPFRTRLFGPWCSLSLAGPSIQLSININPADKRAIVTLEEKPINGARWNDGGYSRLYPINSALERLKSCVEQV